MRSLTTVTVRKPQNDEEQRLAEEQARSASVKVCDIALDKQIEDKEDVLTVLRVLGLVASPPPLNEAL